MVITDGHAGRLAVAQVGRASAPPASHAHGRCRACSRRRRRRRCRRRHGQARRSAASCPASPRPSRRHRGRRGGRRDAARRARAGRARRPRRHSSCALPPCSVAYCMDGLRLLEPRHHRRIAGHQRAHRDARARRAPRGSAPATSASPPVLISGKISDATERTCIAVYSSSLSIIGLGDQADALLRAAEALGVELRILADDQAFRDLHAAVDHHVLQPRAAADIAVGQHHRLLERANRN